MSEKKLFKPHKKQRQLIEALENLSKRFFVLLWGRQVGKTEMLGLVIKDAAFSYDRGSIAFIAPTLKRAKALMWQRLMDHFVGLESEGKGGTIIEMEKQIGFLKVRNSHGTYTSIRFYGWNGGNIETIRGQTLDLIVMDEVDWFREFFSYFTQAVRPTLATTKGSIIMASSPKNKGNMFQLEKIAQKDDSYYHSKAVCYDNPFADEEEIEQAKASNTESTFAQEYLAEYVMAEGAVFDTFDEDKHVYGPDAVAKGSKLPSSVAGKEVERYVGVDFGYGGTHGRTAIVYCYVLNDDTFWIEKEEYDETLSPSKIARKIIPFEPTEVFADPADKWRISELEEAGLPVRQFHKGKGSRHSGLERMRIMLDQNRLFFHESCQNTIAEVGSAEWKEHKEGSTADPDMDPSNMDHSIDAIRYIVLNVGEYYNPYYEGQESVHDVIPLRKKQIHI